MMTLSQNQHFHCFIHSPSLRLLVVIGDWNGFASGSQFVGDQAPHEVIVD